jgi:hypothetical protein
MPNLIRYRTRSLAGLLPLRGLGDPDPSADGQGDGRGHDHAELDSAPHPTTGGSPYFGTTLPYRRMGVETLIHQLTDRVTVIEIDAS